VGKLPNETLKDVLKCVKKTSRVIVPPRPGFDSGAHKVGDDRCMVVSTDPCIGVPEEWFGWFLIHFAASDVAVFGAQPQYGSINLLAPLNTKKDVFERVMKQTCEAADELSMTIITGHTGTYDELSSLVGTCTAYGFIRRDQLITPAGARPGDHLICTKPIGLETLVNFALIRNRLAVDLFGQEKTLNLSAKVKMETCVDEALLLARMGGVTAMHDATEGGFVAALNEMADASNAGFSVDFTSLPILPQLRRLGEYFSLTENQILSASSTGTLLAAVSPKHVDRAIGGLSEIGLDAKSVGVFSKNKDRLIKFDGKKMRFPRRADDPYARIMFGH
jgi:hydrogenase expression/formation protein HypE